MKKQLDQAAGSSHFPAGSGVAAGRSALSLGALALQGPLDGTCWCAW